MPKFIGYSSQGYAIYFSDYRQYYCPSLGIYEHTSLESLEFALEKRYRELEVEYTQAYDI